MHTVVARLLFSSILLLTLSARAADREDQAIRETIVNSVQNWSDLKIDANDAYFTSDPQAVFFDVTPLKFTGWVDYRESIKEFIKTFHDQKIQMNNDLTVRRAGKFAWATFTWNTVVNFKDGRTIHLQGRSTEVLEKQGGKWKIIHEHWSVPASL